MSEDIYSRRGGTKQVCTHCRRNFYARGTTVLCRQCAEEGWELVDGVWKQVSHLDRWDAVIKEHGRRMVEEYQSAKEFLEKQIGKRVRQRVYLLTGMIVGLIPSFGPAPHVEVTWDNGAKTDEYWNSIELLDDQEKDQQ